MRRTRFAPSPTGFIHVGNLRTAIYTYLIARGDKNGKFILRIEDTDRERFVEGAVEVIYETLKQCNLTYDEGPDVGGDYGPYIQSERKNSYKKYALELVEKEEAYYCFCTLERLQNLREEAQNKKENFIYDGCCKSLSKAEIANKINSGIPYVIRQKTPEDNVTTFKCEVYGQISINNSEIEDQILIKSDGYPTYNFANVIDDNLMKITHVVRGNEYLTSTPKYTLLYKALGFVEPTYVHLPHVVKEGGKKLSKREGDAYFSDFVKKGYLPTAIVNYVALLGWSPEGKKEILSLSELEKQFSIKRINKSPAVFDIQKLNWVNSQYLKKMDDIEFSKLCLPYLIEGGIDINNQEWTNKFCLLFKDRLSSISEITKYYQQFLAEFILEEEAAAFLKENDCGEVIKVFKGKLSAIETWNSENIKTALNETGIETKVKGKLLFMPMRIATTGMLHGPDLPRSLELIDKDEVLRRIEKC